MKEPAGRKEKNKGRAIDAPASSSRSTPRASDVFDSSSAKVSSDVDSGDRPDVLELMDRRVSLCEGDNELKNDELAELSCYKPPSFAESQFATIVRRQRKRRVVSPTMERLEEGGSTSAAPLAGIVGVSGSQMPTTPRRRYQHRPQEGDDEGFSSGIAKGSGDKEELIFVSPAKRELKNIGRSSLNNNRTSMKQWEFAGWGSMSMLELSRKDLEMARRRISSRPKAELGQWRTASICGNALTGSAFYSLPAVLAASSIFTPLGLFLAILLLWPFRPIICELASALKLGDAGSYTYFMNTTGRSTLALVAAAFVILDSVATGVVSAGTAASYILGEVREAKTFQSPIAEHFLSGPGPTIVLLAIVACISLLGTRGSGAVALVMISIHLVTMTALIVAGLVTWARLGNGTLIANWHEASATLTNGKGYARAIFDSFCVSFIGLTGIETSVLYTSAVKDGEFPKALRDLHMAALLTEPTLALLIVTLVPMSNAFNASNVLSYLAERCTGNTGPWLKYFVVIDAVIVLAGGILTGAQATIGLTGALASDSILSKFVLRTLPKTGAHWVAICLFFVLSLTLCASSGFNVATLSSIFSMTFLGVMTLFPISALLVQWNRPSLPREPRTGLAIVLFATVTGIVAIAGNIALAPWVLLQLVAYLLVIFVLLYLFKNRVSLAKCALWFFDQQWLSSASTNGEDHTPGKWHITSSTIERVKQSVIDWIHREKRAPVVFFTKIDEISHLNRALRYVEENEDTSRVILVHCFHDIVDIPSELEANAQLIDEAYPQVTVDLVFVEASFSPDVVEALSVKLNVAKSRMFIGVLQGQDVAAFDLADLGGVRIITE